MLKLDRRYRNKFSTLKNFSFNCITEDRYIYVNDEEGRSYEVKTPFLNILKPYHSNKDKNYIILEISRDFDFNEEIGDFIHTINTVHEFCQENVRIKSKEWFGKEFDIFDLDNIIKKPIDERLESTYIKILIPEDEYFEEKVLNLKKGSYIMSTIRFIGMKILRGNMIEEWLLESFVTQKEYDDSKYIEYIDNTCNKCEIENIQTVEDIIVESEDKKNEEISEENNINSLEDNIEIISVQDTNEIISVQTNDINNNILKNKSMRKKKKVFIGRNGSKKTLA
jgi:hypothetical protein